MQNQIIVALTLENIDPTGFGIKIKTNIRDLNDIKEKSLLRKPWFKIDFFIIIKKNAKKRKKPKIPCSVKSSNIKLCGWVEHDLCFFFSPIQ